MLNGCAHSTALSHARTDARTHVATDTPWSQRTREIEAKGNYNNKEKGKLKYSTRACMYVRAYTKKKDQPQDARGCTPRQSAPVGMGTAAAGSNHAHAVLTSAMTPSPCSSTGRSGKCCFEGRTAPHLGGGPPAAAVAAVTASSAVGDSWCLLNVTVAVVDAAVSRILSK